MATPSVGLVKFDTGVDTSGLRRDMKRAGTELAATARTAQGGFSRALGGGIGGLGSGIADRGMFGGKGFKVGALGARALGLKDLAWDIKGMGMGRAGPAAAGLIGAVAGWKFMGASAKDAQERLASGDYGGWSKEGLAGASLGGKSMKDIKGFGSKLWDKAQSAWGRVLFEGGVSGRMYAGQSEADARATILKQAEDDAKEKKRLEDEAKKLRKMMSGGASLAPASEYSSAAGYSMVAESQWAQRRTQMTSVMAARLAEISRKLGKTGLEPAEGVA